MNQKKKKKREGEKDIIKKPLTLQRVIKVHRTVTARLQSLGCLLRMAVSPNLVANFDLVSRKD